MIRLIIAICFAFLFVGAAAAQRADDMTRGPTPRPGFTLPKGPIGAAIDKAKAADVDEPDAQDLLEKIDAAALPDAKYALRIAQAADSKLIVTCLETVVARIEARQNAVKDMEPLPDPALITKAVRVMIAFDAINPDSPLMVACSPLANKVKMKARDLIGQIMTGGAGLAKIFVGLP